MTFTNEQLTKAKTAKSAEELIAMAKESGIEMAEDEAKKYFAELNKQGELTDDELTSVAGGSKGEDMHPSFTFEITNKDGICPVCGANMTFVDHITTKSGRSSYFVYYCPEGDVNFHMSFTSDGYAYTLAT